MKTEIGDFLAALRKSKGYTQQESAELLGVSNKTVSSWETGASCPDISMLPALAELYGVTCDEIVRGQRIPQEIDPAKGERVRRKALSRLLEQNRMMETLSAWIAAALIAVACIIALLVAFTASLSLLGFGLGCIFLIAAVATSAIITQRLRFSVGESAEYEEVMYFLRGADRTNFLVTTAAFSVFLFLLPLAFFPHEAPYVYTVLYFSLPLAILGVLLGYAVLYPCFLRGHGKREADEGYMRKKWWRYRHVMLMFFTPFLVTAVVCGGGLLGIVFNQDEAYVRSFHYASVELFLAEAEHGGPFDDYAYTITEERPVEGRDGIYVYEADCLFPDFPDEYRSVYRVRDTDEGTIVTVSKYEYPVNGGETEDVLTFYTFSPEMQGTIVAFVLEWTEEGETPVGADFLFETPTKLGLRLVLFVLICSTASGYLISLPVLIPLYLKKRRELDAALAETKKEVQTQPESPA